MEIKELMNRLESEKPLKWDRKVKNSEVEMALTGDRPAFKVEGIDTSLVITKPCHDQIAERMEIPIRYYHRMETEAPELLVRNVNTWLQRSGKEFFVRGIEGKVRAFLSHRYRVIDHLDIIYCALNELQAHDAVVDECYISATEMNIKVKSRHLTDFVRNSKDRVIGGLLLTNSETGHKALKVEPRIFRVLCKNGLVMEEFQTRQVHLGNGSEENDEMVYLSIRRSIRDLFSQFGVIVNSMRETTEIKVVNPQRVINNVVGQYRLSEAQKNNILMAFGAEPEHDKYGIANAVTRAAQMEEKWEDSIELEKLGGRILGLPVREFKALEV